MSFGQNGQTRERVTLLAGGDDLTPHRDPALVLRICWVEGGRYG